MPTVRYLVDNVDQALPFYEGLGFKLVDRWGPPFAVVKKGALTLWISGPGTSARKPLADGSVPQAGGWNRVVVSVRSLDKTLAKLQTRGMTLRSAPVQGPGGTQALIEDPSGNLVELFEPRAAQA